MERSYGLDIRPRLHLQPKGKKYYKPHAEYTLPSEECRAYVDF